MIAEAKFTEYVVMGRVEDMSDVMVGQ